LVEELLVFGEIAKGVICQGIEVNVPGRRLFVELPND
jgi:hypothetical protein